MPINMKQIIRLNKNKFLKFCQNQVILIDMLFILKSWERVIRFILIKLEIVLLDN